MEEEGDFTQGRRNWMGEKSESKRLQSGGGQRIRAKTFEVVPFFF